MTEQENDILNATFKLGEAAGLLSKHRKTDPERVAEIYRMMGSISEAGQELMDRDAGRPTLPPIDSERHAELIVENADLKRALGYLLHNPVGIHAQQVARKTLDQPVLPYNPRPAFTEYALAKGYTASDLNDFIGAGAPREGEYQNTALQDQWEAYNAALGMFDPTTGKFTV